MAESGHKTNSKNSLNSQNRSIQKNNWDSVDDEESLGLCKADRSEILKIVEESHSDDVDHLCVVIMKKLKINYSEGISIQFSPNKKHSMKGSIIRRFKDDSGKLNYDVEYMNKIITNVPPSVLRRSTPLPGISEIREFIILNAHFDKELGYWMLNRPSNMTKCCFNNMDYLSNDESKVESSELSSVLVGQSDNPENGVSAESELSKSNILQEENKLSMPDSQKQANPVEHDGVANEINWSFPVQESYDQDMRGDSPKDYFQPTYVDKLPLNESLDIENETSLPCFGDIPRKSPTGTIEMLSGEAGPDDIVDPMEVESPFEGASGPPCDDITSSPLQIITNQQQQDQQVKAQETIKISPPKNRRSAGKKKKVPTATLR